MALLRRHEGDAASRALHPVKVQPHNFARRDRVATLRTRGFEVLRLKGEARRYHLQSIGEDKANTLCIKFRKLLEINSRRHRKFNAMAAIKSARTRAQWITIFENALASKVGGPNSEGLPIMQELRMPHDLYFAVMEALRQGRWRDSETPVAYVKTVARREARKAQLTAAACEITTVLEPAVGSGLSHEDLLERTSFERDTREVMKGSDGIWRPGGGGESDYAERYDQDEKGLPLSLRGRLRAKLPAALMKGQIPLSVTVGDAEDEDTDWKSVPIKADFENWAVLAGFDEWEKRVLQYHLAETSRERALAAQPNESARKALQAAWKRYDRTGKQRLRTVARKLGK